MTILEMLLANDGPWDAFLEKIGINPNDEWVEPRRWSYGERLSRGYYICPRTDPPGFFVWLPTDEESHTVGDEYGPYRTRWAAEQAIASGDHLPKTATTKDLRPLLDEARAMIERLNAAVREAQP